MEQLKAAMLAPEDLTPGFSIVDDSTRDDPPQASRFLIRLSQDTMVNPDSEQIYVGLAEDASADLVTVAEGAINALRTQSTLEDVIVSDRLTSAWLTPGAIAHQFAGRGGIRTVFGNLYTWRQGPVVASLMVITNTGDVKQTTAMAAGYAELQRDKLAAALSLREAGCQQPSAGAPSSPCGRRRRAALGADSPSLALLGSTLALFHTYTDGTLMQVWLTTSTDSGASWSAPVKLTTETAHGRRVQARPGRYSQAAQCRFQRAEELLRG